MSLLLPLRALSRPLPLPIRLALARTAMTASAPPIPSVPADAPVERPAPPALPPSPETVEELRLKAIKLYKELHRLGRDYPDDSYGFNTRLRRAFEKNSKITDPELLKKQLELGEHIKKEVKALISLKKYRHLKRAYPPQAAE